MRVLLGKVVVVLVFVTSGFAVGCSQGSSSTAAPSALSTASSGSDTVGQDVGQPGQVRICHFRGHEGPASHDFVTAEQQGAAPAMCDAEGGLAMWVSVDACKDGHAAINRVGMTCDGPEPPVTFDFEELAAVPGTSFVSTKSALTLTVTRHDNATMGMQDQNFFIPALTEFGHRTIVNFLGPSNATAADAALVLNFSAPVSSASISFGDVGDPFPRDDDSPVVLTAFSGPNGTGAVLGSVSAPYPDTLGFGMQGNGAIRTLTLTATAIQSLTISSGGPAPGSLYYDNVVVQK